MALYHVGIKAVHWLSVSHHHIVGDIDNVVNRTQAYHTQFFLQPLRAFLYFAICNTQTSITFASIIIFYFYINRQCVIINDKSATVRTMQASLIAILHKPSIKIASYTPMAQSISSVSGNINFNYPVALKMIILGCGLTYRSVFWQNNNSIMSGAHAYFVFCTNHTEALYATQFRFFNNKFLIAIIEHAA